MFGSAPLAGRARQNQASTFWEKIMDFATLTGPELDAHIDAEVAFLGRVWKEQLAAGVNPLLSASCYREWRAEVLKVCGCGATTAGCRVHAPA